MFLEAMNSGGGGNNQYATEILLSNKSMPNSAWSTAYPLLDALSNYDVVKFEFLSNGSNFYNAWREPSEIMTWINGKFYTIGKTPNSININVFYVPPQAMQFSLQGNESTTITVNMIGYKFE